MFACLPFLNIVSPPFIIISLYDLFIVNCVLNYNTVMNIYQHEIYTILKNIFLTSKLSIFYNFRTYNIKEVLLYTKKHTYLLSEYVCF